MREVWGALRSLLTKPDGILEIRHTLEFSRWWTMAQSLGPPARTRGQAEEYPSGDSKPNYHRILLPNIGEGRLRTVRLVASGECIDGTQAQVDGFFQPQPAGAHGALVAGVELHHV